MPLSGRFTARARVWDPIRSLRRQSPPGSLSGPTPTYVPTLILSALPLACFWLSGAAAILQRRQDREYPLTTGLSPNGENRSDRVPVSPLGETNERIFATLAALALATGLELAT